MNKRADTSHRNPSRREFLRAGALTGAALTAGATLGPLRASAEGEEVPVSGKLRIKIAGYDYDRVQGLIDGRVQIEGCEAQFEVSKIGEMNTHVFSGPKLREVTEIGLLPFILASANEDFRDYTLLPIFPLRAFRHKSIFIRTDRGITKPADLRARKIATPGYSSTSLTWIRGILQDEYGVSANQIQWVISSKESSAKASGGASKWENVRPAGLSISMGPQGKDESELLVDGDVDALFHAAEPRAYQEGHPQVARLFADSRKVERAYFAKTGIFPIMHAVAVRRDATEAHPWLPKAVFDAYSNAKQAMYDSMRRSGWYMSSLPWFGAEFEETRELMGDNYWPYGIEPNRKALEALFQYSYEQGLAERRLKIEDVFHRSTLALAET